MQTSDEAAAAFRTLFDNIRVLPNVGPTPTLVFAGTSTDESVRAVTTGLAAHAERLGLNVLLADLADWNGRPILRRRSEEPGKATNDPESKPLDLGAPSIQVELTDWLESAGRVADVIVIEGRPLTESIDAALLARFCGGLVIVAQTEVTHRDMLQAAAERARVAGCRILGVVMYGTKHRLPQWIRRFVRARRRSVPEE